MPATWMEAEVVRIADASPRVRRFFLSVKGGQPLHFRAGQFLTFDLPVSDKRLHRWKSYSIASAPAGTPDFELCIVRMEGGLASSWLFDTVKPGQTLRFKGPEGGFVLPDPLTDDLVMICTGTGIAPFRSMLHDLDAKGWTDRRVHLIYGSRTREDLLYADEWLALREKHPDFRYTACLSRLEGTPEEDWLIPGYVHGAYRNLYADPMPDRRFMLCGWTNMIDEAVVHLMTEMHVPPNRIVYELYG